MQKDRITRYFFIGLFVLLAYFTFLMVKPMLAYMAMAIILTYFTHPIYKKLHSKIKSKSLASGLMILIILLVIIIPTFFIVATLVDQVPVVTSSISKFLEQRTTEDSALSAIGSEGFSDTLNELLNRSGEFMVSSATSFLGSLPGVTLGLFIMFFLMYYGFKEGEKIYKVTYKYIPLKEQHKKRMMKEVQNVSSAVLYGQVMTSIIQGALGGLGFLIFGIPNPVFWGFVMILLSFLPIIGTPIVWVPAGLYEIFIHQNYVAGIGILIFGTVVIINVDNLIRPKLISGKSDIHPAVVLIGVLGGLAVFGFAGMVLGPLIMALLISMVRFYTEEKSFVL
ncbi:AI-2E family transporter [Nanoarchaeota archaeon]